MTPEEYFIKWAENCRIFIDYKPIHDHADMMQFAKDYHAEQLRIGSVSNRRELLISFSHWLIKHIESDSKIEWDVDDYLKTN